MIPEPERYEHYRDTQPFSLRIHVHGGEIYGEETRWLEYQVLDQAPGTKGGLWTYRRLIDASLFPSGSGYADDISMINWQGNDYRDRSILDRSPLEQAGEVADADVVLYPPHPGYRQARTGRADITLALKSMSQRRTDLAASKAAAA